MDGIRQGIGYGVTARDRESTGNREGYDNVAMAGARVIEYCKGARVMDPLRELYGERRRQARSMVVPF